jgi:hypothetical protein
MTFEVSRDTEQPKIQNDGMKYEGLRFRSECRLAGKLYGRPFGVELYPIETHIAEKLHEYTMPRARPNTRVKDLPDIALLATARPLNGVRVRSALEQTFDFRATHTLPSSLPVPPATWSIPYREMARENELAWATIERLTTAVSEFLNPVLAGRHGTWHPAKWIWDLE